MFTAVRLHAGQEVLDLPEQNVDLVRRVYRAVNENDLSAYLAVLHPEVELTTSGVFPDLSPTYRGYQGAVDYWKAVGAGPGGLWDAFTIELRECEPIGDQVVASVHQRVEGRDGVVVEHDWGHLYSFAEGLISRARAFVSPEAAKEAAVLESGAERG
jgi:ketosteroid isomerase-like protein